MRQLTIVAAVMLSAGVTSSTAPGSNEPRIFAEGVISTSDDEFGGSFTPTGDTVYFSKSAPHSYRYTMLESHRTHGTWSTPSVLPFSGRYSDSDPTLSPDGRKMFWTSDRPHPDGTVPHDYDVWMVERTPAGTWGKPQQLPPPINSPANEYAASMTRGGTLYFSSARDGGIQVFRSTLAGSTWSTPENVTRLIDQGDSTVQAYDLDVMIDPDEHFIMLGSIRPDTYGNFDLYVSWNRDGKWTPLVHLPAPFNTRARDYSPHLSPDGRTLYFSSERGFALDSIKQPLTYRELTDRLRGTRNGSGNIYEISVNALVPPGTTSNAPGSACPSGVASKFSWWVGTWSYFIRGYDPATSTVTATNGGCALAEAFVDRSGAQQHTTIQYDSARKQWKRHVVDPSRTYDSIGQFANDGSIAFYETTVSRESYRPTDKDHVHFVGESSKDGGKTWSVDFDALYTRRP
jgi:WD40 repeat protein